ncbi:MAG: helix-turn-helix domain-containing protein [Betaproteobacteria bacterium]|nr:helix-turn-helix domain-containing protein [Betaproteobacteria bacterium]
MPQEEKRTYTFSRRLKEARQEANLSQERLGILAGIDEGSASARINQYERGKHAPNFLTVKQIAEVLNVPEAYFYTENDNMAQLLRVFHRKRKENQEKICEYAWNLKTII